ncbi:MAG: DUF559 domain-containing protein [Myxococcaceae bacterium]|nr:DUF559 domain-containing protein [Myxococcaceae bacterium]
MAGAPRTWEQRLRALALWAGNGSVFSHTTAAALWGFTRFRARRELHVTLRHSGRAPNDDVRLHEASLDARDVASLRGFRVTSVTRTLLDLAATRSIDRRDVLTAADEAVRNQWTTVERLDSFAARHAGHRGVRLIRRLVTAYLGGDGPCESELESRVLEFLEDRGFPRPRRQRTIMIAGRLRRLDFCFPGTNVVIEADGYAHHASAAAFEKDRARLSQLTARGYRVLQWTWRALHQRPDQLAGDLRQALSLAN